MTIRDKELNQNSPENVLGWWLVKMSDSFQDFGYGGDEYDNICCGLLANILDFADRHEKAIEMLQWIISSEGTKFLDKKEYQSAGNMVSIKTDVLCGYIWDNEGDVYPDSEEEKEETLKIMRKWIDMYAQPSKYVLQLW